MLPQTQRPLHTMHPPPMLIHALHRPKPRAHRRPHPDPIPQHPLAVPPTPQCFLALPRLRLKTHIAKRPVLRLPTFPTTVQPRRHNHAKLAVRIVFDPHSAAHRLPERRARLARRDLTSINPPVHRRAGVVRPRRVGVDTNTIPARAVHAGDGLEARDEGGGEVGLGEAEVGVELGEVARAGCGVAGPADGEAAAREREDVEVRREIGAGGAVADALAQLGEELRGGEEVCGVDAEGEADGVGGVGYDLENGC